jgi:hypothetical protein
MESGDSGGGLSKYAGMAEMVGIDLGGGGKGMFQGDNLLELYKSRKMIESALLAHSSTDSSKLLIDLYLDLNHSRIEWKKKTPQLLNIDFGGNNIAVLARERDSILQKAVMDINKQNLEVGKFDKKSSIVKVDVQSEDEIFSKEFNEALVNEVNTFYIETKTKKSLNNIDILQSKTDSIRSVMNGNINASASVIDATPNLNPTRQAQRLAPTQRSQFSAETNKAILAHLVQNLEMSKMSLMREAPLIQKVDVPIFPLEKHYVDKIKATIIGAVLFIFLTTCLLLIQRIFRSVMSH